MLAKNFIHLAAHCYYQTVMNNVNDAISNYLGLWWDESKAKALEAKYGKETLSLVKEI
jgi:hypothetical protein